MQDIYEKLNEADDNYTIEVDSVLVYVHDLKDGEESLGPDKVTMSFDIEIEYRSWGIKDITVTPRGRVNFEVEIVDADNNHVEDLEVDFDFVDVNYDIDWISGSGYTIESLTVEINRDGTVTSVTVGMYFPSH